MPRRPGMTPTFVAIDFETADYGADSACALGLVRCRGLEILEAKSWLIRPPRRNFTFTWIHGIEWSHVADKPPFADLWPELREFMSGAEFLAAHNARFDKNVLGACCAAADIAPPERPFLCTVRLARSAWGIRPTKLPDVCRSLDIRLKHHDALSDAEACARIVIAALKDGLALPALEPEGAFSPSRRVRGLPRRSATG